MTSVVQHFMANPSAELEILFEERRKLCMLFFCLRKDDARYGVFDKDWLRDHFLDLTGVPRYTLMTTLRDHTDSMIVEYLAIDVDSGKLFSAGGMFDDRDLSDDERDEDYVELEDSDYDHTIRAWNCDDGSLIATMGQGDEEHTNNVEVLEIYGGRLYSGSTDRTVKLWNIDDYTLLYTLDEHLGPVGCLAFRDQKLYVGSYDEIIAVYDCAGNDHPLIHTFLEGHTEAATCLAIQDGKLYSGSDDNTIKIWDCDHVDDDEEEDDNGPLITTLTGHTDNVYCLIIDDGKLYSGSRDSTIKVWNCSTHDLNETLIGHTESVFHLKIHGGKLYSGSRDSTIKVWNCSTNELIKTLAEGHTKGFTLHDGKLYSGSCDDTIKIWDCSDDSLITTLRGHTIHVKCLAINHDTKMLYSGSDALLGSSDDTVKVWSLV